ncbi:hypothetical protein A5731_12960 [Mycolicibacterium conceptionense]|uniref:hypothetical protein n=1 Tax=Mycolicibacterium conceptionense TaxID=451644 RepID=UPI0007EB37E8|nr:hypothetical protein [Mycolicibacterium conceptionense]OBB14678.1 hypothetical protein A5718_30330 [Mycolicibacterium conceptionense]OBF03400.1 hypothetical protein A5731_12960 [Mycolicibacterium conceptionense]
MTNDQNYSDAAATADRAFRRLGAMFAEAAAPSGATNETDQELLDQLDEDLMRLAELADAEADRLDADVLAELDRHVQDLDDLVNPAPAMDRPLAEVINIADRRMGRRG